MYRMKEDKVYQYLGIGGKLFLIRSIDTIRDGGTIVIETNLNDTYYVHKTDKTIHTGYEPTADNLITDKLLCEFILDRIQRHIEKTEADVIRYKNILDDISGKNG